MNLTFEMKQICSAKWIECVVEFIHIAKDAHVNEQNALCLCLKSTIYVVSSHSFQYHHSYGGIILGTYTLAEIYLATGVPQSTICDLRKKGIPSALDLPRLGRPTLIPVQYERIFMEHMRDKAELRQEWKTRGYDMVLCEGLLFMSNRR